MDMIAVKCCTACRGEKPATSEYFHYVDKAKTKLAAWCKSCKNAKRKTTRKPRVAKHPRVRPIIKVDARPERLICKVCSIEKPYTAEFFTYATKKTGQLRTLCKDCQRAEGRAYAKAYKLAHPEASRAYRLAWRKANPEASRVTHSRRRARKNASARHYKRTDVINQMKSQQGKCYWCQQKIVGSQYDVDHIFALAKGGSNGPENICISCRTCNNLKQAKDPHEFIGRLF